MFDKKDSFREVTLKLINFVIHDNKQIDDELYSILWDESVVKS